jgi:hypothetical protein
LEHRATEVKNKCGATARRESALGIPILEKRLALPATPVDAGASPFAQLFEPGPIILRFPKAGSRRHQQSTNRLVRLDPLAVIYLGFLVLAGFLGFWLGG